MAPTAGRTLAVAFAVVLAGILLGRLVLERTGAGMVLFLIALPVVFLIAAALLGLGRAAIVLGLFSGTALLMRVIVLESGWVVLLLAPVIAVAAYVAGSTIQMMAKRPRD